MAAKDYFKGKRIAVIGLGPHGEMVSDVSFLIKSGALVSIYALESEARLKNHLTFLRSQGLANYVCSSIPGDDLLDMEMIILSHEYSRESTFLQKAKEKNIPIEYPETLFFKKAPPVTVVGVMGQFGKSTIVSMLRPMLQAVCENEEAQGFFVIDPESDNGIITHLKKAKNGDLVLMRITSTIMRELHEIRISPQVAIFTSVPDKNSYTEQPFEILNFQTYNNFIIGKDEVIDATRRFQELPRAKMLRTKTSIIPPDWEFENIPQQGGRMHDRENAALVIQAASLFKVDNEIVQHVLSDWKRPRGRLELLKKVKHVEFYNDAASVNAESTIAALQALDKESKEFPDPLADANGEREKSVVSEANKIILILGGAQTTTDHRQLYSMLPEYIHTLVLLPGSGTLRERFAIQGIPNITIKSARGIEEAVGLAYETAQKGDKILFSPGFEVGGFESSRKSRGERFVKAVRGL